MNIEQYSDIHNKYVSTIDEKLTVDIKKIIDFLNNLDVGNFYWMSGMGTWFVQLNGEIIYSEFRGVDNSRILNKKTYQKSIFICMK